MANIVSGNPFIVDSVGILCTKPMHITAVLFNPAAATQAFNCASWNEQATPTLSLRAAAASITGTNTFATTNLITAGAAGAIFKILGSTGDVANLKYFQIASITGNDDIVIVGTGLTNEGPFAYALDIYPMIQKIALKAHGTLIEPVLFVPDGGLDVPNLACGTIGGGIAYIYFTAGAYNAIT